jgi:hypothetical protein
MGIPISEALYACHVILPTRDGPSRLGGASVSLYCPSDTVAVDVGPVAMRLGRIKGSQSLNAGVVIVISHSCMRYLLAPFICKLLGQVILTAQSITLYAILY